MTETNVFELSQPGTFSDPLTEVLGNGVRTLLGRAVEAEVAAWLSTHTDKLTDDGRRRLVRNGHMPEREVMTGIGLLPGGEVMGGEYVALNPTRADHRPGSFKINVRTGRWADFACGDKGGDPVSLCAYLEGVSQTEAARRLARLLGIDCKVQR